jgi:hypothetical protein
MSEVLLELYKKKKKLFDELLSYVERKSFKYTEDEVQNYAVYTKRIKSYIDTIKAVDEEISSASDVADKEVCEIEEECKVTAKKIYDIDIERNRGMKGLLKDIKTFYLSSKNQVKYFGYTATAAPVTDAGSSFDIKQ